MDSTISLIPTMIGAPDMAFPKVNAAAFWLVPVFALVLLSAFSYRVVPHHPVGGRIHRSAFRTRSGI